MSFVTRNDPIGGDDHRSHFPLYEDDNADQHEEHQGNGSELPAEIPDSQPDPYLPAEIPDSQPDPYLPAEIPDSQPDRVYRQDLPFGDPDYSELSSQLPTPDQDDIHLGDAEVTVLSNQDILEEAAVDPRDCNLDNQESIDPRASRLDGFRGEPIDDSIHEEAIARSSSTETEIIPRGTPLAEELNVSPYHHPFNLP